MAWNPFKSKEIQSLGITGAPESTQKPFDSAKAEQINLFTGETEGEGKVETVATGRLQKGVEMGKAVLERAGNFFKGSWKGSKAEKVVAYAVAPDIAVQVAAQKVGEKLGDISEKAGEKFGDFSGKYSDISDNVSKWVGTRLDNAVAGADSLIDKAKDAALSKFAQKIGLRDKMNPARINSPEVKNSILGLDSEERSMGGELIVGSTIFDRVKDFYNQVQDVRSRYEQQQQAMLDRRAEGEAWLARRQQNISTGKNVSRGVSESKAEKARQAEARQRSELAVGSAQRGEVVHFSSYSQIEQFIKDARELGVDLDAGKMQIEIGQDRSAERSQTTVAA